MAHMQNDVDGELDHDKYLYDMKDFSACAEPNRDPEMYVTSMPKVPEDPEDPSTRTKHFLTLDARTKGNFKLADLTGTFPL